MPRIALIRETSEILVILAVGILGFYGVVNNSFCFDDHLAIENNPDVDLSMTFSNIFVNDIWGKSLKASDSHRSYRPFLILTFRVINNIAGLDPLFYHYVSLIAHGVCSVLLFFLVWSMTRNQDVGLATALLFVTHPVHLEAIASAVNLAEPISLIFAALCVFISQYFSSSVNRIQILFVFGSATLGTLSLFFKETGLTVFLVVQALLALNLIITTIQRMDSKFVWKHLTLNILWGFTVVAVFVGYFLLKLNLIDQLSIDTLLSPNFNAWYLGSSQLIRKAENPFAFLRGREKYLSQMYLHFRNFYLLMLPTELCAEYAFDCIPKVTSVTDPRFVSVLGLYVGLAVVLACGFGIIYYVSTDSMSSMEGSEGTSHELFERYIDPGQTHLHDSDASVDGNSKKPFTAAIPTFMTSSRTTSRRMLWQIDCRSIVYGCIWLIVPFLPMSGVLTLGTLLAERLLYTPSVGYCMLLVLGLHIACYGLYTALKFALLPSETRVKAGKFMLPMHSAIHLFCKLVFWILISAITVQYILILRHHVPHWKDDATLFTSALKTCSRSAKLNLQVAKIHLNAGNLMDAEKHIDIARSIDPEFCDIGYQQALLNLRRGYIEQAMDCALDNLSCLFTSKGSMELVTKVWEQELLVSPSNFRIVESHADQAARGKMWSIAIQKYITAATMASEQLKFTNTLRILKKVYKMAEGLRFDTPEEQATARQNFCHLYHLGGRLKSKILQATDHQYPLVSKTTGGNRKWNVTASEVRQDFKRVLYPECVTLDHASRTINLDYVLLSRAHILSSWGTLTKPMSISELESLAHTYEGTSASLDGIFRLYDSYSLDSQFDLNRGKLKKVHLSDLLPFYNASRNALRSVWNVLGKLQYEHRNYTAALNSFSKSLNIKPDHCEIKYWWLQSKIHAYRQAAVTPPHLRLSNIVDELLGLNSLCKQSLSKSLKTINLINRQVKVLDQYLGDSRNGGPQN